jgi:hypothetical protein
MNPSTPPEFSPDTHFHHPSWPERWSHPEFEDTIEERSERWRDQPWRNNKRHAAEFLKSERRYWPWGFIIYRTVYTPESDEVWSAAMEKLDRAMHSDIDGMQERPSFAEKLVREGYKNVVMEDKELWDGASLGKIQKAFRKEIERVESIDYEYALLAIPRHTACLVIDEECLQSIKNSPEEEDPSQWQNMGHVFVVDPRYPPEEVNSGPGNLPLAARFDQLWNLVVQLSEDFTIEEIRGFCETPGSSKTPGARLFFEGF